MPTQFKLIAVFVSLALMAWLGGAASWVVAVCVAVVAIMLLFVLPPTIRYFVVVRPQKAKAADALVIHKRAHPELYNKR